MKKIKKFFKILSYIRKIGAKEILFRIESFSYDALTGLYNRRALDEKKEGLFTLVFIDLDNFKEINDSLGYKKGDEVLRVFADILKSLSRKEDVFVRWGGDEFILILPGTEKGGAEVLVERIREKTDKLSISFSFGILESNGKEFSSLIKEASEKMQEQKNLKKRAVL